MMSKKEILDMETKAKMSGTTLDTMRSFVVDACEELFKYLAVKEKISEGLKRIKRKDKSEFGNGTYNKGFVDCAELILDFLDNKKT